MVGIPRHRGLMFVGKLPALLVHPDQPFEMRNRQNHRDRVKRQEGGKLRPQLPEIPVLYLYDVPVPVYICNKPFHRHLMEVLIRFIIKLHHRVNRLFLQRAETVRVILF